jgi:hypothetical protein
MIDLDTAVSKRSYQGADGGTIKVVPDGTMYAVSA